MTSRQYLSSGAVLALVTLAVVWPSLGYEWHWDDLHLLRVHSAREIGGAFLGTWDPDGVETKGLRPLTLLFNDARARLFGEWTYGHRLLLVGLFSLYLTQLASLARRLGTPWYLGLGAGILTLAAKNSLYHVVWIADGIHLVPALFFTGAVHALFGFVDSGRPVRAVVSALCLLGALAAREDALALFPIAIGLGFFYLWIHDRPWNDYVRLARYGLLLFLGFLAFWTWRLIVVPSAPNFRMNLGVFTGPPRLFDWTICLSGQGGLAPWLFRAGGLALVAVAWRLPRLDRRRAYLWLALAAFACVPGAVIARPNLLLFPVSFYAIFVAITVADLARRSWTGALVCLVALVLAAGASVRASRLEQRSAHAMSYDKIFHDWFGLYSQKPFTSIPPARRARVAASLARLGIVDGTFDFTAWERDLRAQGRVGFIDDGRPFMPARRFLSP